MHAYISAWFRGEVPRDRDAFARSLRDRWARNLVNVQPSGDAHTGGAILDAIEREHGANPDFTIRIEDVEVLRTAASGDDRLCLATYVEVQQGARHSARTNGRRTSVWLRLGAGDRVEWLHIHETGLSASETEAARAR